MTDDMRTGLPPQESKMYTEDDLNHILARKMAKVQIDHIENKVITNEAENSKSFVEIKAMLDSIKKSIIESHDHLRTVRDDLKHEIDREFVNKDIYTLEMKAMDTKIDAQWKRITAAVSVAYIVIQFGFQIWGK